LRKGGIARARATATTAKE